MYIHFILLDPYFFFNDTATTEIYPLSLHAALPISDKLKALGTLLSGVAHELNNPLSAVLVAASLLKLKYRPSDAARAPLDVIERQCVRAARIVGELLAFARRTPPQRRQVDPNEVLRAALSLEAPEFDLNQIRVITRLG